LNFLTDKQSQPVKRRKMTDEEIMAKLSKYYTHQFIYWFWKWEL